MVEQCHNFLFLFPPLILGPWIQYLLEEVALEPTRLNKIPMQVSHCKCPFISSCWSAPQFLCGCTFMHNQTDLPMNFCSNGTSPSHKNGWRVKSVFFFYKKKKCMRVYLPIKESIIRHTRQTVKPLFQLLSVVGVFLNVANSSSNLRPRGICIFCSQDS